jgi:CRISPR-associated protein Cmr1
MICTGIENTGTREWEIAALTDIWSGSLPSRNSSCIVTTGLLGSIRWWYEVLMRGLGGTACDPTDTKCISSKHCAVCELFGCTGWARKFRFKVVDRDNHTIKDSIKEGTEFTLRFTPLRPIQNEEWALIDATMRLIAEYGAIGGRTVLKPSNEKTRKDKKQHKDYGLVKVISTVPSKIRMKRAEIERYIVNSYDNSATRNSNQYSWASLKYFWFVDEKTLSRNSSSKSNYNRVLGRGEDKNNTEYGQNDKQSEWLSGSRGKSSKKIFSFKKYARTFGFVNPDPLIDLGYDEIRKRLQGVWGKNEWEFIKGNEIIDKLLDKSEE